MNWINVHDKHFVDIEIFDDGSYRWVQNNNCPKDPFLVGLFVNNNKTGVKKLEYWLVILSDNGLEEWTENETYPFDCWSITDIEFWCPIFEPKKNDNTTELHHDAKFSSSSRFFIDERVGCIAVRDKKHPKYNPNYPGLHNDTVDVIFYAHGTKNNEGWFIDERFRRKAQQILEHLQNLENEC